MPDFPQSMMPTMQTIMDLARSIVNDMFPGINGQNGRILTNDALFTIPYFNEAFKKVQRKLRVEGVTFPDKTIVLVNVLPLAAPNPSTSVYIGYNGYFDGSQMHAQPALPNDLMQPYEVWEQDAGSNLDFVEMAQPQEGIQSVTQGSRMGLWQWANYHIVMPGSLVLKNLWLRYKSGQPPLFVQPANFSTTVVNIIDSESAMAYAIASQYAEARGADTTKLDARFDDAISDMALEYVRRSQSVPYRRQPYQGPNGSGMLGQTVGRN